MASMTLYYFDFPGRGETARIMLTMAKKEFTVDSSTHSMLSTGAAVKRAALPAPAMSACILQTL